MKRWVPMAVAGLLFVPLAACGGGTVTVQAQIEGDSAVTPLADLEVRALPYDRDAIFDSLEAAYPEPEPQVPDSLVQLQERYAEFQRAHTAASDRWSTIRDSMQSLRDYMGTLSSASEPYLVAFGQFTELEGQVGAAERAMNQAFDALQSVEQTFSRQASEYRTRQEVWANEAFADFAAVTAAKQEALGRQEVTDTTDANGVVYLNLPKGEWWIHARHLMPFEELYWNVPIQVTSEPQSIVLDASNAQVRIKY